MGKKKQNKSLSAEEQFNSGLNTFLGEEDDSGGSTYEHPEEEFEAEEEEETFINDDSGEEFHEEESAEDQEEDQEEGVEGDEGGEETKGDAEAATAPKLSEDLVEQNKQLQAIIKNLTSQQKAAAAEPAEAEAAKVTALKDDETFKAVAEELGLDELGSQKLSLFMETVMDRAEKKAIDQTMQAVPTTINQTIDNRTRLEKIKTKFYDDNPILSSVQPYVSQIANQISQQEPDLSVEDVLGRTAEKAYQNLGISKDQIKKGKSNAKGEAGKRRKPAFAKTSGSRKKQAEPSKFEQEIGAMLALDE